MVGNRKGSVMSEEVEGGGGKRNDDRKVMERNVYGLTHLINIGWEEATRSMEGCGRRVTKPPP